MAVGGLWAGIAGVLKVTRGVHEVISTIMLNFIAIGIGAYLLENYLSETATTGDLIIDTKVIPASGRIPSLNGLLESVGVDLPVNTFVQGIVVFAVAIGVGYFLLVWRTRFGFDLRASGTNPGAARASGVNPKSMIITTMLISGGIAGLVGMAQLVSQDPYRYSINFQTGLGFTGIAVALLGRNHPVGIAIGAVVFGFLDRSAQVLDLEGVPKEIVVIMQGIILLSVVIAYAVVSRWVEAQEVRAAARATGHDQDHRPADEPVPA